MEIQLNNKIYIQADEIVRLHPEVFKEGKKKARQIIQFKRIPQDEFIFGSFVKAGWRVSNEKNNKAKLLITKKWLDEYINSSPTQESNEKLQSVILSEIKDAPPILELIDSEKFKDHNGKILDIEVRGKRDMDRCFFRVKDVAVCFNDIRCQDHILDGKSGYSIKDHYLYMYRPRDSGTTENIISTQKNKELFLTYDGMLRYLFVSRSSQARDFQKWASKILFAMQMGTREQKESVGAELFGVSPEIVSKFFGTCCVRDTPMAYLLKLSEPFEYIKIPYDNHNDWLIVKPGQHGKQDTKYGFIGRMKGHKQEFKEFKDTMEYMHFVFVDPMYVSDVETKIKEFFSEFKLDYGSKSELFLIHKSRLEDVKKFFRQLSVEYSGNHADIQREWDKYRNDVKTIIHNLEMENRHLKEMMEQKDAHYKMFMETMNFKTQAIIDNLQERVGEQAKTLRTHEETIKLFITRLIS